jgi:hypothetical protein
LCNFYENKKDLITSKILVEELTKFNEEFKTESTSNLTEETLAIDELEVFNQAIKQEQNQ